MKPKKKVLEGSFSLMSIKQLTRKPVQKIITLPPEITLDIQGTIFTMKGKRGEIRRQIYHPGVVVEKKDQQIIIHGQRHSKHEKKLAHSLNAHLKNMVLGVTEGFTYTLKICSGHFPISVKVDGERVMISNFLGEKIPRVAPILKGIKVAVQGDTITVEGNDIEDTGQTAANIEIATRIRNRDRHVFQDGCYITSKPESRP